MVCGCISKVYRHPYRACAWSGFTQVGLYFLSVRALHLITVRFIRGSVDPSMQRVISTFLFLHPGFIIVDHIHFQYNGFMYGILLWSLLMARNVRYSLESVAFV
jgi:alpha-1,3-glucosyltransferase